MEQKGSDRWTWDVIGREDESKASGLDNVKEADRRLGDHAASRYRRFRRSVEQLEAEKIDQELFGMLLSAESMRDELRVFDEEASSLVHLAQTGSFVRQLQRLHAVLDAAVASYSIQFDEASECGSWEPTLRDERRARADWYRRELERVNSGGDSSLVDQIDSDAKAEEIMTLLKAAVNKYGPDGDEFVGEDEEASSELTSEELSVIKTAFNMVATRSNIIIMTLPTWFVLPFEFGATFGMSTWGVDRFILDHKDEERFIREASGWSELNHPHVAKFLGACHVGDEKFVAHEKVRSMMEYASVEREDRKKVWERMYEVGLALQYMFERGFVCPLVKLDHLYCARYEDRAVMFGVDLRECMGTDDKEFVPAPKQSQQGMFDDAWVESLVIAIVNVLDKMTKSANDEAKATVDEQKVIEAYRDVVSVPNPAPSCLDDHEWRLLKQLREITGGEFLRVVDTLGELAEVHSRHDWLEYVPMLECQIEGITRVKDMKATLMGETIEQLLLKCREAITAADKPLCSLVRRFDNIIDQLQQKFDEQSDWSNLLKPIAHLSSLLRQFSSLVKQQVQMNSFSQSRSVSVSVSASVSARASAAYSQQTVRQLDPGRVYSLHTKLDQFLILHELSSSILVHDWLREWKDEHRSISSPLVDHEIRANFDTEKVLSMGSSVLSRWFIPREQIDFDEHGAFSEGAFGSVHEGKWFQTPVIVKRVKQHTTTETQFRQEADVWFQLNHINVVKMYGACDIGDLFFVCEYASGGDLDKYLDSKGRDPYLMWYCLLNAALGLQYLHNNGIVHADLKANNILVGGDGVAKLTDFGLSVRAKDPSGASAGALGAYQWKAPECLSGSVATFASDVYSFAMVMIEVMSGSCPWGEDTDNDTLKNFVVTRGRLPPRPSSIGDSEWGLIERMCARDPTERVPMDTVVTHLSSLLQRLDQEQLWHGDIAQPKNFKNRVVSRDGILLNLVDLTKSENAMVAAHAGNQIVSVAESRNGPSSRREVDAVINLLYHGTERQKALGANVIGALAEHDFSLFQSSRTISELLIMLTSGTAEQIDDAATALTNLSRYADIYESMLSLNGIEALLQLVRNSTVELRHAATTTLANLARHTDISESMLALNGIDDLLHLMRTGTVDHKHQSLLTLTGMAGRADISAPVLTLSGIETLFELFQNGPTDLMNQGLILLANLAGHADISAAVLSVNGIAILLLLVLEGTDYQKKFAAVALANLAGRADISESVLSANGIDALLRLVRAGTDDQRKQGMRVLANLAIDADISESMLRLNGVEALMQQVQNGTEVLKQQALEALANLAGRGDISAPILALGGIDTLVQLMKEGTDDQKKFAAMALANLAVTADISASVLSANGIDTLLLIMREGTDDQKKRGVKILANLTGRADISAPVTSADGIDTILQLMQNGTDEQKDLAAITLMNLSSRADISEPVLALNGCGALIQLMRGGSDDQKKFAAMSLANMSIHADISEPVLSANGTEVLLQLVRDGTDDQKHAAAMTLANLSICERISESVLAVGGIGPLVRLMRYGTEDQKNEAMYALANFIVCPDISVLVLGGENIDALVGQVLDKLNDQSKLIAKIAETKLLGQLDEEPNSDMVQVT